MADYFRVDKTYLIEHKDYIVSEKMEPYYLNEETSRIAQEAFENPELRILCNASRDLTPEDLNFVIEMVRVMKQKEKKQ